MSPLTYAIGWTLLHFVWQGTLLACAAAVALAAMRNTRPEYRYAVACAALLACLLWPAADLALRLVQVHAPAHNGGAGLGARLLAPAAIDAHGAYELRQALRWVVGIWALCAAALALRMALGLLWIGRAARTSSHASLAMQAQWQARLSRMALRFGVTRTVRLRLVDTLASPVTAGWWRPVVLLPAALVAGMPPDLLEALLAHEMAHIKHHDYLVNLLQNVIETLLFYHPAVWWLSHRIRLERELMADDLAATQLGEPRRLALALSELERMQFASHHLAIAANGGDLVLRIKRLMQPAPQAMNWKAAIPALGLVLACISVYAQAVTADRTVTGNAPARIDFDSCVKPRYPAASLAAGETGTVTLQLYVDADGKVAKAKVVKSSGHPVLDEAARAGIEQCRFHPAIKDGKPVGRKTPMQYAWVLDTRK